MPHESRQNDRTVVWCPDEPVVADPAKHITGTGRSGRELHNRPAAQPVGEHVGNKE